MGGGDCGTLVSGDTAILSSQLPRWALTLAFLVETPATPHIRHASSLLASASSLPPLTLFH